MDSFFERVDPQVASDIASVSLRMYELREARKRVLAESDCADTDAMVAALRDGRLPEHPGYESWLSTHLMGQREYALRDALHWQCRVANGEPDLPPPPCTGLAALGCVLEGTVPPTFAESMALHHDGLAFRSTEGIQALVRIVTPGSWSFEWRWKEALWRLDTAPVEHAGVSTRAHLHRPDGSIVDDPLALPYAESSAVIVRGFLNALAQSPTLGFD